RCIWARSASANSAAVAILKRRSVVLCRSSSSRMRASSLRLKRGSVRSLCARAARRRAVHRADRLPHRRNDLHRRRAGNESLMKVFEQIERRRHWSEDEALIIEQVRRLAETVIRPNADHHDRTAEFPWRNVEAINDLGLNGLFVPEA